LTSSSVRWTASALPRLLAFTGLVLVFPCPWYFFAVGGLLPLAVIAKYGLGGGIVLAASLVHVAVYATLFYFLVRRIRRPRSAAIVLAALFALSFAPIYGEGENLAAGGKLNRNAWQTYR
jgi:hypothetical protein